MDENLFIVSSNKVPLVGSLSLMRARSHLIDALGELPSEENIILAPNIPLGNKNALEAVWSYLNGNSEKLSSLSTADSIQAWSWLNYFDVPYDLTEISDYIEKISTHISHLKELIKPENKEILNDVLLKVKIISPGLFKIMEKKLKFLLNPDITELTLGRDNPITLKRENLDDEIKKIPGMEIVKRTYYKHKYKRGIVGFDPNLKHEFDEVVNAPVLKYQGKFYTYPKPDVYGGYYSRVIY